MVCAAEQNEVTSYTWMPQRHGETSRDRVDLHRIVPPRVMGGSDLFWAGVHNDSGIC